MNVFSLQISFSFTIIISALNYTFYAPNLQIFLIFLSFALYRAFIFIFFI